MILKWYPYALYSFSKDMSILFPDTLEWSAKTYEIHFSELQFLTLYWSHSHSIHT